MVFRKLILSKWILICTIFIIATAPCVYGIQPMEVIKGPIDQILSILQDPLYHDTALKDRQFDKLWQATQQLFDFNEMARRTLGRNWKKLSNPEKSEFTDTFTRFLANTYILKIQGQFKNEQVLFLGQQMISDRKAMIKTKIIRETVEIPVDYSLRKRKDIWRAYDIKIEGVSLVKNYRTQFNQILTKQSPAQLIERLKLKIAKQEQKRGSKK